MRAVAWQRATVQIFLSFRQLMLWQGKQCIQNFSTLMDVSFSTLVDEKIWVQIFCNLNKAQINFITASNVS
jgi:hypothetical protein